MSASDAPVVDCRFDTAAARLTRHGIPASAVTDRGLRRMLGWETVIVMGLFPLPATLVALTALASHISAGFAVDGDGPLVPGQPILSAIFAVALTASELGAAGIVVYLLVRSREGVGAIGLGGRRLRMDLALVVVVWFFVQLIPQSIGAGIVRAWNLPTFHVTSAGPSQYLVVGLVTSVVAGVLEEIVVLGYLVRRLEQRGWSVTWIVVVAVAVRVSYHLYYGPGVIPIVLWATASVLFYMRVRRLLPFIICHVAWDTMVTIGTSSHGAALSFDAVFFVVALVMFLGWRRWHPEPVPVPAGARPSII